MTIHPRVRQDLMLAPVAAEVDINLQHIRDRSGSDLAYELEIAPDAPADRESPYDRAQLVLGLALRDVDMHGWSATITDDYTRVRLDGGSVSIDLGLGADLTDYILYGIGPDAPAPRSAVASALPVG